MYEDDFFELFIKNPYHNTDFPLFTMDCNNSTSVPKRQRFQEMHWHEDLQIVYVLSGSVKIQTLRDTYIINKNDIAFINKRILHQITGNESTHYRSFIFPDALVQFYENSPMNKYINDFVENSKIDVVKISKNEPVLQIVKNINQIVFGDNKQKYQEYKIAVLFSTLMYEIMTLCENISYKEYKNRDYHIGIQKCLVFMHQHYFEDIALSDIAKYGNMSVGHCGRVFQEILDTTPYEYLVSYRIKKSLELLARGDLNISYVATSVGFNSISNYIQSFKKRMKITPKQYQKQLFNKK